MPAETPRTTAIPVPSNQRIEPGALCFPGESTSPKAQGAGLITLAPFPHRIVISTSEDRPGREGARLAIGRTAAGRYLRVVYVADPEPNSLFVITAYELRGKPLTAYRRRRRRK